MSKVISNSERAKNRELAPATPKGTMRGVDNTAINKDIDFMGDDTTPETSQGFGDNSYTAPSKPPRSISSVANVDDIPRNFLKPSDIVDEPVTILSARFEDSNYNGKIIPNVWLSLAEYDKDLVSSGKAVVAQMHMVQDNDMFPVTGHFELVKRGTNNRWEFLD